jgi:CBS domain-containing protein
MSLKVRDIMVQEVVTVHVNSKVTRAVDLMNKFEIGCLIVVFRRSAVGIVTERDILKRVLGQRRDVRKTRIGEIMSKPLVFGDPNMDVEDAASLMFKKKIKKLPIRENGKLIGLVTLTDLVRYKPQIIGMIKKLAALGFTPRRMRKVVDYYVV